MSRKKEEKRNRRRERREERRETAREIFNDFVACFSIEVEAGIGIGGGCTFSNGMSASAYVIPNRDTLTITSEDCSLTRELECSAGVGYPNYEIGYSANYSVDRDDVNESHRFYTNSNGIWTCGPYDSEISFGGSFYCIFGGGARISFDIAEFYNRSMEW